MAVVQVAARAVEVLAAVRRASVVRVVMGSAVDRMGSVPVDRTGDRVVSPASGVLVDPAVVLEVQVAALVVRVADVRADRAGPHLVARVARVADQADRAWDPVAVEWNLIRSSLSMMTASRCAASCSQSQP